MISVSAALSLLIVASMSDHSNAKFIYLPSHQSSVTVGDEDPCLLPKETGNGRAFIPSFYFDADQQACLPFIYGGHGGNANRFENVYDCEAVCMMDHD